MKGFLCWFLYSCRCGSFRLFMHFFLMIFIWSLIEFLIIFALGYFANGLLTTMIYFVFSETFSDGLVLYFLFNFVYIVEYEVVVLFDVDWCWLDLGIGVYWLLDCSFYVFLRFFLEKKLLLCVLHNYILIIWATGPNFVVGIYIVSIVTFFCRLQSFCFFVC